MDCPNCHTQVLEERILRSGAPRVDVCPRCEGSWFDAGELAPTFVASVKRLRLPASTDASLRICPACERMLLSFRYPQTQVSIDMCPDCRGFWLEKGERDEIVVTRTKLHREGKLDPFGEPGTIKANLVEFIDAAIRALVK